MEVYFYVFMNWKQNDWARFLLMAEFVYNNSKNANISHTPFELNYGYHRQVFFKNKYDTRSKFSSANRLAMELRKLINICCQNQLSAQDL